MATVKAGIIGGAGYTGGEMIRILINHPQVQISFVHSKSNTGKFLYEVHEDLTGDTDQQFSADWNNEVDVLFLCVGHGEAKKILEENAAGLGKTRIIDLSQDFRLHKDGLRPTLTSHPDQPFIYGLPEINRDAIRKARYIANPGCFATAIQLGLLPLAAAGLLRDTDVYTTGITGSTGAGQGLSPTAHFSWRANNIQAYKTLNHQHLKEIGQSLRQVEAAGQGGKTASGGIGPKPAAGPASTAGSGQPNSGGAINFIPWRGDFTRGIFVSSQLRCDRSLEDLTSLFTEFYQGHPFTILSRSAISLKQVVNTNKCLIQLEQQGGQLVIHSAIDNLTKGASGQAVQNMNLLFGLDETAGLHLKANAF
ncbi:MAG: N-acetyl-gamma-glutamyl-phosphate reductase [Bacteroidota bacterium]